MMNIKNITKHRRGVDYYERRLALIMVIPALMLVCGVVVYPIGDLIYLSFHTSKLTEPWLGTPFVGFHNFREAFGDSRFWGDLVHTLIYVAVTVPGALLVGIVLALLANIDNRFKWVVRLALLLPWAMPRVFAGLIFHWFFQYDYGLVNNLLVDAGLPKLLWLSHESLAYVVTNTAIIWKSSSFMALIILAGLQTIPTDYYEAASLDGANRWRAFFSITLPLLKPSIVVALIFRTITALQTFDVPYAMTNGGPGHATETLAMYVYHTTLDYLNIGYGAALAVMMFLLSFVISVVYLRFIRQET